MDPTSASGLQVLSQHTCFELEHLKLPGVVLAVAWFLHLQHVLRILECQQAFQVISGAWPPLQTASVLLQSTLGLRILGSGQRAKGPVLQRCLEKMERGVVVPWLAISLRLTKVISTTKVISVSAPGKLLADGYE